MDRKRYEKACPICGKTFVPCATNLDAFNWRRVACSVECGREYFRRVLASRGEVEVNNMKQVPVGEPPVVVEETYVEEKPSAYVASDEPVEKPKTKKVRNKQTAEEE